MIICYVINTIRFQGTCSASCKRTIEGCPEHCSASVLDKMGKPHIKAYKEFSKKYFNYTKSIGKEQYLVPYLMSSHPGATLKDAVELAEFIRDEKLHPEQVQDYYPTPGTISTAMYYSELDPYTLEKVFVAKSPHDKALQRALMQYFNPKNYDLVYEALKKTGRHDLIGTGPKCLIKPKQSDKLNNRVSNNYDKKRKKTVQRRKKNPNGYKKNPYNLFKRSGFLLLFLF